MCANLAAKHIDSQNFYDEISMSTAYLKSSPDSTFEFLLNLFFSVFEFLLWELRFRVPPFIVLCIVILDLSAHYEVLTRDPVRRRRVIRRTLSMRGLFVREESDSDEEENEEEDEEEEYEVEDDDEDIDNEDSDMENQMDDGRIYAQESMLYIDPDINPDNEPELFDFVLRHHPMYDRDSLRCRTLVTHTSEVELN